VQCEWLYGFKMGRVKNGSVASVLGMSRLCCCKWVGYT